MIRKVLQTPAADYTLGCMYNAFDAFTCEMHFAGNILRDLGGYLGETFIYQLVPAVCSGWVLVLERARKAERDGGGGEARWCVRSCKTGERWSAAKTGGKR